MKLDQMAGYEDLIDWLKYVEDTLPKNHINERMLKKTRKVLKVTALALNSDDNDTILEAAYVELC